MQEFTLIIDISADGEEVVGEVKGIAGKRCHDIQGLLDQVGQEIEHRHTADWDKPEPVQIGTSSTSGVTLGKGW